MSDRILFRDVIPYDVPESLGELRGPASGSMILPHTIHWGPDRRVDLDTEDGRLKAYRTIVREGTAAQQSELLNATVLLRLWPLLRLPERCRATWEARIPELAAGERLPGRRGSPRRPVRTSAGDGAPWAPVTRGCSIPRPSTTPDSIAPSSQPSCPESES